MTINQTQAERTFWSPWLGRPALNLVKYSYSQHYHNKFIHWHTCTDKCLQAQCNNVQFAHFALNCSFTIKCQTAAYNFNRNGNIYHVLFTDSWQKNQKRIGEIVLISNIYKGTNFSLNQDSLSVCFNPSFNYCIQLMKKTKTKKTKTLSSFQTLQWLFALAAVNLHSQ